MSSCAWLCCLATHRRSKAYSSTDYISRLWGTWRCSIEPAVLRSFSSLKHFIPSAPYLIPIVKNTPILMHRIKHFRSSVPQQIRMTIPENAPTANSDHVTAASWLAEYNTTHFRSLMFFKGPLLSIYAVNANVSTLPILFFSINLFSINRLQNACS